MSFGCKRAEAALFNRTGAPFVFRHLPYLYPFFSLIRNSNKKHSVKWQDETQQRQSTCMSTLHFKKIHVKTNLLYVFPWLLGSCIRHYPLIMSTTVLFHVHIFRVVKISRLKLQHKKKKNTYNLPGCLYWNIYFKVYRAIPDDHE